MFRPVLPPSNPNIKPETGPIPEGIYYCLETDNFYKVSGGPGMGNDFYIQWGRRWKEFPHTMRWDEKPTSV